MKENDNSEYIHDLENSFFKVLSSITVGSKRFLTNKVDRSVSGLIAQQQCVGPLATPLSNYALLSDSMFPIKDGKFTGIAIYGEQPILSLLDPVALVQKTFSEMLTNLMWCKISNIEDIKCSANWMWPNPHKNPEEGYKMYIAMKELTRLMTLFRVAVDGGKDSLSMSVKYKKYNIDSPGTLVLSSYVRCPNIYNKITPDIKKTDSCLYFIDLSSKASESRRMRMGGCSFLQTKKQFDYKPPRLDFEDGLHHSFKIIQYCIDNNLILSGHDKSDGGLITTLLKWLSRRIKDYILVFRKI